MNLETERKFLVTSDAYRTGAIGIEIAQGYLCTDPGRTVRARLYGDKGFLTIKGRGDITRAEFEYAIPADDARHLLEHLCHQPVLTKHRYRIPHAGWIWEVDEFHGANEGLVVAEIELPDPNTRFERPPWVGREVTGDIRYFNSRLSVDPFSTWTEQDGGSP
jgi:CYTH domain-containing protein